MKLSNKKKIPNILTIFRIILFIPIVILITIQTPIVYEINLNILKINNMISISWGMLIAGILFLLSAFTDWLDGHLARKWKVISDWGKLWDPIADKILINSLLITFSILDYIHFSLVIIFITRDTVMDGLRMFALRYNVVVAANIYGKLKTIFQLIACTLTLFIFALPLEKIKTTNDKLWYWIGQMFFYWIAMFFSIISWGIYYYKIVKMVKIHKSLQALKNEDFIKKQS